MAATKPGHLSKKNLKQYLEARTKRGETAAEPKVAVKGNRTKKSLAVRAKPKQSVLKRRRVRSRIAAGK
ncbi:MAG: hypothetical protein L0Y66_17255 [Myxococcaceae bacterium]|nr:hypothetical protein [Myxococcaceae bacterium]MCI0669656.1 hypothetical protein [Myxococcaceae bacterium]